MTDCRSLSDLQLIDLLRSGDRAAFTEIYGRYSDPLLQTAYNRLRDKEQCRDVVQNVFTSLWDRREQLSIQDLSAYLHSATRFQVINIVTRNPRPSLFTDSFEELINSPASEDVLLEKDVLKLLEQFIAALPAKRREIFIRRYQGNQTTTEIAAELDISRKTVQNQLKTAEDALKSRLAHLMAITIIFTFLKR